MEFEGTAGVWDADGGAEGGEDVSGGGGEGEGLWEVRGREGKGRDSVKVTLFSSFFLLSVMEERSGLVKLLTLLCYVWDQDTIHKGACRQIEMLMKRLLRVLLLGFSCCDSL